MAIWNPFRRAQATESPKADALVDASSAEHVAPRRKKWWILAAVLIIIAIGIGVGVGVGVGTKHHEQTQSYDEDEGDNSTEALPIITIGAPTNTSASVEGDFWRPKAGDTWQIVLSGSLTSTGSNESASFPTNASIYDVDLFDTSTTTISALQAAGIHVICYFSAGSFEDWRPDAGNFTRADYGHELKGWPGEWWLDTTSTRVREIMSSRLDLARTKGCDGVDPDNVDGYMTDNDSGVPALTPVAAVDYLTFLAGAAHTRNLAIGLKNAGPLVPSVLPMLQWVVSEQCGQYAECAAFRPFIAAGKPVFRIEYPRGAPSVEEATRRRICEDQQAVSFSTLIKEMELGWWAESCEGI